MQAFFIFRKAAIMISGLLSLGLYCLAQNNQLILPETTHKIPFTWAEGYAAMLIPVKLSNCPRTFYMQFDTGSPHSMFYRNKLKAIGKRYAQPAGVTDTTGKLRDFGFSAGNMPVLAKEIAVQQFDSTDIDWSPDAIEIIGTLGTDLIDGKILTINYPGKYISISEKEVCGEWFDLVYERRSILLPVSIKGQKTHIFFDTGSSAFGLLTNKETAFSLSSPDAAQVVTTVGSWGKPLKAISVQTNDSIEVASLKIPLRTVTFIEGVSDAQVNAMKKLGIGGMMGNGVFLDLVLVIDTERKRFWIGEAD